MRDREKKASLLGEVILIVTEGAVKLLLVTLAICAVLFVLTVWLGLSPLHAVWIALGASVVTIIVVSEVVGRRRSRG